MKIFKKRSRIRNEELLSRIEYLEKACLNHTGGRMEGWTDGRSKFKLIPYLNLESCIHLMLDALKIEIRLDCKSGKWNVIKEKKKKKS